MLTKHCSFARCTILDKRCLGKKTCFLYHFFADSCTIANPKKSMCKIIENKKVTQ